MDQFQSLFAVFVPFLFTAHDLNSNPAIRILRRRDFGLCHAGAATVSFRRDEAEAAVLVSLSAHRLTDRGAHIQFQIAHFSILISDQRAGPLSGTTCVLLLYLSGLYDSTGKKCFEKYSSRFIFE